jgi:7-carboxy-7-deazaguanine synthase
MKINEIFFSIQGESSYAGLPCVFIRLTGCNLRCSYCDTTHAYEEGEEKTIEQVIDAIARFPANLVEITGGEPLLQNETPALISTLAEREYRVLLETNGSLPLRDIHETATAIMDIKCPGSGMSGEVLWDNLGLLRAHDEIKFVLTDRTDFEWASEIIEQHRLQEKHLVHISPAYGVLEPGQLAAWMLDSRLIASSASDDPGNVRLQLQLHKYIWPGVERGV